MTNDQWAAESTLRRGIGLWALIGHCVTGHWTLDILKVSRSGAAGQSQKFDFIMALPSLTAKLLPRVGVCYHRPTCPLPLIPTPR